MVDRALELEGELIADRKSFASAFPLGTPGSSPALEATLERGAPRDNSGELVVYV